MKISYVILLIAVSSASANEVVINSSLVNQSQGSNHSTEADQGEHAEGVVLVEIKYEAIREPFFLTLVVLIAGLSKIGVWITQQLTKSYVQYNLNYKPFHQAQAYVFVCHLS